MSSAFHFCAGEDVSLSTQPLSMSLKLDQTFDPVLADVTSPEYAQLRDQITAGVSI